jgi:hypothetical protein
MHIKTFKLTSANRNHALFGLKVVILATCLFTAFGGHYPPASAQRISYRVQTVPVITTEDALQDNNIDAINKHLQSTDDVVKAMKVEQDRRGSEMDNWHGEERIIEGIIGLMVGSGLFLQVKQHKV